MNIILQILSDGFAAGWPLTMLGASLLGVFISALPGLNPVMAIALLLSLTYSMDPLVALGMVTSIDNGSMYLFWWGDPAAHPRQARCHCDRITFNSHPMVQRGEAAKALKIACWSSAIGGTASARRSRADDARPAAGDGRA